MKTIYVIHPFGGDPENMKKIEIECRRLISLGYLPMSTVHLFSYLNDHIPNERQIALNFCKELIYNADGVILCGEWWNSIGCRLDLVAAIRGKIPVYRRHHETGGIELFIPAKEPKGEESGQ